MGKILTMMGVLTVITLACGALLGGIKQITEVRMKQNQQQGQIAATKLIFPGADVAEQGRTFGAWLDYTVEMRDGAPVVTKLPSDKAPMAGWRATILRLQNKVLINNDQIIAFGDRGTQGLTPDQITVGLGVEQILRVKSADGRGEIEVKASPGQGKTLFPVQASGSSAAIGVAFRTSAKGYGGDVGVMVGFDLTKAALAGIAITDHGETPGLGAKAETDPSFREQFNGLPLDTTFSVRQAGGAIDAISGATVTSKAVCEAVSDAVAFYQRNNASIRQLVGASNAASSDTAPAMEGGAQ